MYRKPPYLMVKKLVSYRFSLKPIHCIMITPKSLSISTQDVDSSFLASDRWVVVPSIFLYLPGVCLASQVEKLRKVKTCKNSWLTLKVAGSLTPQKPSSVRPLRTLGWECNWYLGSFGSELLVSRIGCDPALVGGLVAIFYFSINIGFIIIPIDFHMFQRGGPTTNQSMLADDLNGGHASFGDFHSRGGSPKSLMVDFMENPHPKWMNTFGQFQMVHQVLGQSREELFLKIHLSRDSMKLFKCIWDTSFHHWRCPKNLKFGSNLAISGARCHCFHPMKGSDAPSLMGVWSTTCGTCGRANEQYPYKMKPSSSMAQWPKFIPSTYPTTSNECLKEHLNHSTSARQHERFESFSDSNRYSWGIFTPVHQSW